MVGAVTAVLAALFVVRRHRQRRAEAGARAVLELVDAPESRARRESISEGMGHLRELRRMSQAGAAGTKRPSVYEEPDATQTVLYDMMRDNAKKAEDRRSGIFYEDIDESDSARPRLETKWNRDASYAALDGGQSTYASSKSTYAGLDNHKTYGDSEEV